MAGERKDREGGKTTHDHDRQRENVRNDSNEHKGRVEKSGYVRDSEPPPDRPKKGN